MLIKNGCWNLADWHMPPRAHLFQDDNIGLIPKACKSSTL